MFFKLEERTREVPVTPRNGTYRALTSPLRRCGAVLSARGLRIALPQRRGPAFRLLDGIDLDLEPGIQVAVSGLPGSGKSTLLHALAGIVALHDGSVRWDGADIGQFQHHMRDAWRRRTLGFLSAHAGLFPTLDALHNVLLPVTFGGWNASPAQRQRATELLRRLGVPPSAGVLDLSREDRCRVKIVRALWAGPRAVLADDPVGNLDPYAAGSVRRLLETLSREAGATLVVTTRCRDLAATFDRQFEMRAGKLFG
jgi:ABC-type lipoprotein export system ATPase subunit